MCSNRITVAVLAAVVTLPALAGEASAADPRRPIPPVAPAPRAERPLTPAEQAASDGKVAAARSFVAKLRAAGFGLASLSCAVPNTAPAEASARSPLTGSVTNGPCGIPSGYLSVTARQQEKSYYCGPAVGQVITNYAWAMASGSNKYSQTTIAGWMKTDLNGMTNAPELAAGLQRATASAPRTPGNFSWATTDLRDLDRNGSTADELQDYVVSAVSSWKMPLAFAVKPHDKDSGHNLSSWPKVVSSPGHWIAAYGWYGFGGISYSRIHYADSSKNYGGGTGKYWNPTLEMAALINEHTRRFVW